MKVTNTTVFRMALQFAFLFELITVAALISVYYVTLIELQDQIDSELMHELKELEGIYRAEGIDVVIDVIKKREIYGEHLKHFYALTQPDASRTTGNVILSTKFQSMMIPAGEIRYLDLGNIGIGESQESLLRVATKMLPQGYKIIVAQSQNSLIELREHIFATLLFAVVITLALVVLSGIYMGRIVLSRITRIDTDLDRAISSNFTEKLPLPQKNDEFMSLTKKLNLMLERIEKLIIGMRQVSDNIAHDLLSPLTRIRSRLEVTLLNSRSEEEYQDVMQRVLEDTSELIATFNALLSIAQAEAKVQREDWKPVDLAELLEELAELYTVVAEDKQQSFACQISSPETIHANRQLLAQAISNLLENAIKYTNEKGQITMILASRNGHPVITVADNGPGIPAKDRERVLQRFQRLDSARTNPGSGLGLSLVDAIAKLHDAKLTLENNKPGLKISLLFS